MKNKSIKGEFFKKGGGGGEKIYYDYSKKVHKLNNKIKNFKPLSSHPEQEIKIMNTIPLNCKNKFSK